LVKFANDKSALLRSASEKSAPENMVQQEGMHLTNGNEYTRM